MRLYEVIFIVKPMEEDATNAVIEKFTKLIQANGGKIEKEDRSRTTQKDTTFCCTSMQSLPVSLSATV